MYQELAERIENKSAHICVVGLGYVGLTLAVECARAGFSVTGIDHDQGRVLRINRGESYVMDIDSAALRALTESGKIRVVAEFSSIRDADIVIVCVPTGLTRNLDPDLQHVRSSVQAISGHLQAGQLICVESTIYPGTTEEVIVPILEQSGLQAEQDFFICHSPERIDPSNPQFNTKNIVDGTVILL